MRLAINEKRSALTTPTLLLTSTTSALSPAAMGDLAAAPPFYERALAINEKALGPDHPTTAALNNLGSLLPQDIGDLAAAAVLRARALAIREKALGLTTPTPPKASATSALSPAKPWATWPPGTAVLQTRPRHQRTNAQPWLHPHHRHQPQQPQLSHQDAGDLAAARPFFERALAIRKSARP
ncbi:MAG: tetratricopeptide repeat protein [Chloroflexota bacterium]